MKYEVNLPRGYVIDLFNIPEDFDEHIRNDFRDYTEGTAEDYTYVDKLGFIDLCVDYMNNIDSYDTDDIIDNLVKNKIEYEWDNEKRIIDENEILCRDFMIECCDAGRKLSRLESHFGANNHHIYDELQKLLVRIIKIVIDWSWE